MLKYCLKRIVYFLFHIFWILPVKKERIYFESFAGKQISCNPLYIYNYLKSNYKDFEFIWCYNGSSPKKYVEERVRFVRYHSFKWIMAYTTSSVLISNHGVPDFIPLRKKQVFINTWHGGGAYKRIALQDNQEKKDVFFRKLYEKTGKHIYLFKLISSSKAFTQCMADSLLVDKNDFFEVGMPRNDIFFDKNAVIREKEKLYRLFGLNKDIFFVLYAPTYRGCSSDPGFNVEEKINLEMLLQAIWTRFKKRPVFAFRMHYHVKTSFPESHILNVTEYPNMQELLCAADMLITDYSSSMWDYSFTGNPCILFAPDIEKYQKERGFYTDPYGWGFPIAKTNKELCEVIENLDIDDFQKKMEMHHKNLGSCEHGDATGCICKFIVEQINKL